MYICFIELTSYNIKIIITIKNIHLFISYIFLNGQNSQTL